MGKFKTNCIEEKFNTYSLQSYYLLKKKVWKTKTLFENIQALLMDI